MANLSIRRGEQREQTTPALWDPARAMDPFRMLDPFRMIRDIMGPDVFGGLVQPTGGMFAPDIEVKETKDGYMVTADLPGVAEGDLEVSVMGNRLVVSGRRDEEERKEDDRFFAYERTYGTFSRSFVLPEGADMSGVKAELKDGVLCIKIPKRAEVQPKRIQIGQAQKEGAAKETGKEKEKGPQPVMQQTQERKAA
jgi:HSP20 family protein